MNQKRFECPACGFQIFNRRVTMCEDCEITLPAELLFSAEGIAALQANRNGKPRERATPIDYWATASETSTVAATEAGVMSAPVYRRRLRLLSTSKARDDS
jgi:hypothetical protein